jgi:Flp pilus assembly protein TadG
VTFANLILRKGTVQRRGERGAAILTMAAVIGLIIFPLICILSFELSRVQLAKQQLQNATDAAALTATAQLASSNVTDPTTAHQNCEAAALKVFQANLVLAQALTNTSIVTSTSDLNCAPGEAKLVFQFIDPITKLTVPITDPNGKIVNVVSGYGAYLAFGKYLGIPDFEVTAIAKGQVPRLDIVICYDVSGSMDDQTPVTFVKQKWDKTATPVVPVTGHAGAVTNIAAQSSQGVTAQGLIFNIVQPPPTGTSLNAAPPQLFEEVSAAWTNSTYYLNSTIDLGSQLRDGWVAGASDAGAPPGNYSDSTVNTEDSDPTAYTDIVCNIDGNSTFTSFNSGGFSIPNLATLVEAARGNLESTTVFNSSLAYTCVPTTVVPGPGYLNAYINARNALLQPIANSQAATNKFCDILNTDTDIHFGFVAFDDVIGTASNPGIFIDGAGNAFEQWWTIDQGTSSDPVTYGNFANIPHAFIHLNSATGITNYASTKSAISATVAQGGTNIGMPLDAAVTDLINNGRAGSVKAIILFTDGEPTAGGPLDGDPSTNARKAAVEASNAGIPIYTIGLAQTPAIEPSEIAILNDTDSNPNSGGIAAIAGHGGTFNLVTDSSQLEVTFEKIARRLVNIVANSSGDYVP